VTNILKFTVPAAQQNTGRKLNISILYLRVFCASRTKVRTYIESVWGEFVDLKERR